MKEGLEAYCHQNKTELCNASNIHPSNTPKSMV